jgi:GNAT superfamily N-acetyltransferase
MPADYPRPADLESAPMIDLPPGFTARPVQPETDIPALVELWGSVAMADYGVTDVDERLVRGAYTLPAFTPETDSCLVLDAEGRAAGLIDYYDGDDLHVAPYAFLRVRPDLAASGLTDALLRRAERLAHDRVQLAPPDARVALVTDVPSVNTAVIAALERNGWRRDRTDLRMEIDLAAASPIPEPAWPEGIAVRTADLERDARAIHAAEEDAFSDHYGFVPEPFAEWFHFRTELRRAEPDLWFLAMDGEEIAGLALCSSSRPGEPDLGWVSSLGVRRPWRRRGLALAILRHAFRVLGDRGCRRVGLGVDAQSLTGATRLYERAGMQAVRTSYQYERLVRDGRDLRTVELPAG